MNSRILGVDLKVSTIGLGCINSTPSMFGRAFAFPRSQVCAAIDHALAQSPADLDALWKLLQEGGCEVKRRGHTISLRVRGWKNFARLDSLGDGYGEADLRAALAGKKEHVPRRGKLTQALSEHPNLLIDIQAELRSSKGAGYIKWVKSFNLKQMAQTLNYLTEHKLLDYAALSKKRQRPPPAATSCPGRSRPRKHTLRRSPSCGHISSTTPKRGRSMSPTARQVTPKRSAPSTRPTSFCIRRPRPPLTSWG